MTRLQKSSLTTLLVGLVLAAFVVPWSLSAIGKATATVVQYRQMTAEVAALPAVDPQASNASRALALEQVQTRRLAAEQAARIKAALDKVAIPGPNRPVVVPVPNPAYSIVPRRPRVASRAPCLEAVSRPAERIERPYGWLAVPARTILVPCGS